jgi:hypothetical protein
MSAPTPLEVSEARRIRAAARDELPSIRRTAESWRNAGFISAGIALAGGVIAGPDAVTDLPSPFKLLAILMLACTFVAGMVSATLAVLASIGWPSWIEASTPKALQQWEATTAENAIKQLKTSMLLAGVALLLAGSTIVLVLVAAEPTQVSSETGKGESSCSVPLRQGLSERK